MCVCQAGNNGTLYIQVQKPPLLSIANTRNFTQAQATGNYFLVKIITRITAPISLFPKKSFLLCGIS